MYYRQLSVLSVLAAAPLNNLATPLARLWDDMRVKHMWNTIPANWEGLGHPPAGTTIDLHIALKPHRENALIDALYEVSDPRHPKCGSHLSKEQVAKIVAPHPDTLELVHSWLGHGGVSTSTSMTHGGGWLTVAGVPVSQANDLLGASYQLYRNTGTNKTILRTVSYALPVALHAHVQTVVPTTYFSPSRMLQQTPRKRYGEKAASKAKAKSGELVWGRDEKVRLGFLRWLYNTEAYVPAATDRNVLGIAGYNGESPSRKDLATFMRDYRIDAEDATFRVVKVNNGKYNPRHPGLEGSMNIQYTEGMTYPTPHIFYSIGGDNEWWPDTKEPTSRDSDLVWLDYLLSLPNTEIPQTISASYGDLEPELPLEYVTALCDLFAQFGTRGVSFLVASGDDGVGKGNCKSEDSDESNPDSDGSDDSKKAQFIPIFPASCPWVTSVGGTTRYKPEVAASLSGGGFSVHFPRPKYQDDAVTAFLQHLGKSQYAGSYNPEGRGIPDLAAQALDFMVVLDRRLVEMLGTSCAAPTVASIISLLNDYLLASGKAPLGFLNPWLYGLGLEGLNDITSGSNPGCNTDGFSATVGWDPVTGLGTPDFIKLQQRLPHTVVPVSSIVATSHPPTPSAQRP